MSVSSCAAQFLSIGTICEALGICSREKGVWIGAALVILFTVFSGLWGVALTDTVQSVILMIAFGLIFPIAVFKTAGGWNAIVDFNLAQSADRMNMFSGIAPISMVGWALYYGLSTGSDPSFSQRIFSAKDTKSAIKGQVVAWAFTLVIVGFVSAFPGLAIGKIFPDIRHGSEFTPLFIVTYLPAALKGIMISSLLGLMLTSGDTYLLLLSSTISHDIVRPYYPDMEEKKLLRLTKLICVLSAALICGMALYVDSIYQLFKTGGGAYGAGVFFPLILGCFWKKAKAKAINLGMLVGTVVSFGFDMLIKIPLGLNIDGVLIGAALCLIICVTGSLILSKDEAVIEEK
jgi:SSS family solute:Na+ symporter